MSAIKDGFEGKRFPSMRRISLPFSAHEIIESCSNIEEVICTFGHGSTIVGSLAKGSRQQDWSSWFPMGGDMKQLASFPLLDTIEIIVAFSKRAKPFRSFRRRGGKQNSEGKQVASWEDGDSDEMERHLERRQI
ncbi:hypothetical protein EV363DRAFT_1417716 [Boletus edulis]|nr:hypothetical protein EV363DRAFT_1417716 [Boletus edulis]